MSLPSYSPEGDTSILPYEKVREQKKKKKKKKILKNKKTRNYRQKETKRTSVRSISTISVFLFSFSLLRFISSGRDYRISISWFYRSQSVARSDVKTTITIARPTAADVCGQSIWFCAVHVDLNPSG